MNCKRTSQIAHRAGLDVSLPALDLHRCFYLSYPAGPQDSTNINAAIFRNDRASSVAGTWLAETGSAPADPRPVATKTASPVMVTRTSTMFIHVLRRRPEIASIVMAATIAHADNGAGPDG